VSSRVGGVAIVLLPTCWYSEITNSFLSSKPMNNSEELIKKTDIQKIAEEGTKIYESIKLQYEPAQNGKFLAIDIESKDTFIGNTSSEAVELARKTHSNKVFYVVKIGFSAAETLATLGLSSL
jgi:hypothetical protein